MKDSARDERVSAIRKLIDERQLAQAEIQSVKLAQSGETAAASEDVYKRQLQDRDQKIDRATALIADLENDRKRAAARITELESDMTDVRAALQKRDGEVDGAVARMQELETTIAQLRELHAGVEQELSSAKGAMNELHSRFDETRRQLFEQTNLFLAVTQAENERLALLIDTVQSSRFWQLKRVLGRVRRAFTA